MIWFSQNISILWELVHSQTSGIPWVLVNSKSTRERRLWEISVFSLTFSVLCKFAFPIFWELYGFLLLPKYLRNPLLWNVCVFPYFFFTMGIHFFHILEIVWISCSLKIVEKLWNVCFFPHTFPVLWEFTFPMFWEMYGFLLHPKFLRNP